MATPADARERTHSTVGEGMLAGVIAGTAVAGWFLHYAAFALIGIIAAAIVHRSAFAPAILVGAFLAFIIAQALIYGFIALLHETELLEHLTWPLIAVGNLIGAGLLGWWLWRRHPGLSARFESALGENSYSRR